jgi:hypothetical protein
MAQAAPMGDQLTALGMAQPMPGQAYLAPLIQAIGAAQRYMRGPQPEPSFYPQIGIRG